MFLKKKKVIQMNDEYWQTLDYVEKEYLIAHIKKKRRIDYYSNYNAMPDDCWWLILKRLPIFSKGRLLTVSKKFCGWLIKMIVNYQTDDLFMYGMDLHLAHLNEIDIFFKKVQHHMAQRYDKRMDIHLILGWIFKPKKTQKYTHTIHLDSTYFRKFRGQSSNVTGGPTVFRIDLWGGLADVHNRLNINIYDWEDVKDHLLYSFVQCKSTYCKYGSQRIGSLW